MTFAHPAPGPLRVLLVGGPMYEPLYQRLPLFEQETGLKVEIVGCLPHPELNAELARRLPNPDGGLDLVSTHTKYAPAQAQHLLPLDDFLAPTQVDDLLPRARSLATIDGRLLQIPRLMDARVLYVRRDCFDDAPARAQFETQHGRALEPPRTWDELLEVATFLTGVSRQGQHQHQHGFLFPGRESGLFGTFYEMLVSAGGELFGPQLQPLFASPQGEWAAGLLAQLYQRQVTPRELPDWHYDEVSACFRAGAAAMVCDWPISDSLYSNSQTCVDADKVEIVTLPRGPSGRRAAYAGCHSFAIPTQCRHREGALALLSFLTNDDARALESSRGAFPVGQRALDQAARNVKGDARASHRWSVLTDLMENCAIIPPRFAAYPHCEDALWRALQKIMLGQIDPRGGLVRAAEEVAHLVRDAVPQAERQ